MTTQLTGYGEVAPPEGRPAERKAKAPPRMTSPLVLYTVAGAPLMDTDDEMVKLYAELGTRPVNTAVQMRGDV